MRPADDIWEPVEVTDWDAELESDPISDEPLGTKEKFWVTDPGGKRWLFKFTRVVHGAVRGEDWAECLVAELARLVGVPTAAVRLATCGGRRGVLSRSVVGEGERLEHGNELLASLDPGYDREAPRENPGYTIEAIKAALNGIAAPRDIHEFADLTAFDTFAGYLMLDAWVAGRDRHHENWAAIRSETGRWLAPSFDHGNALGFQESDENRRRKLDAPDGVRLWAERGRSQHFAGRPPLVRLAGDGLALAAPRAAAFWRARLEAVTVADVENAVNFVPQELLSVVGRSFCTRLLLVNRERLLHVI
ncbi:hypothetical protein M6B22_16925 [Jatrophihabitans cynanchi]|uniref:HipA-like C-terminal domain-containing protein n=1 Tax=Jatrophihabitans cynanchi TaxID=2944128 RepID=A0ABY7JYS3_9ACTN|nr:hypothetical protein [Jatrophihabitans sp. SB3-54]WAX56206.1 hypothetical protein M6B22_16925 [Jatrophihabitans sp. SB3-54]